MSCRRFEKPTLLSAFTILNVSTCRNGAYIYCVIDPRPASRSLYQLERLALCSRQQDCVRQKSVEIALTRLRCPVVDLTVNDGLDDIEPHSDGIGRVPLIKVLLSFLIFAVCVADFLNEGVLSHL